jgi:hypothetical protein
MSTEKTDKKADVAKKVQAQKLKNLERALKEERLGLTAISTAFVQTHGHPEAMLAKLEAMVRSAVEDPRVKPRTKSALIAGQQMVDRALRIHLGQPQPLFTDEDTPNTGHVNPGDVKRLANPPEEQQVGLFADGGNGVADAVAAHEDRESTTRKVNEHIVKLLRANGPQTDPELLELWVTSDPPCTLSRQTLYDHRVEMVRSGRLIDSGEERTVAGRKRPVWDLLERTALTA